MMRSKEQAQRDALLAAREYGIGTILFRNALAKKLGLSLTESLCLTILGIRGASTPTELARFTGLTTGSTTTMLDRLETRRFITRKPNPHDRRGVIVEIDDEYSALASELVAGIQKANQQLVAAYSEQELAVVAEFLTRLADNLAQESSKI